MGKLFEKVFVPITHDGTKGWIFDFVCPSYALSAPHKRLLLLKNATVNWNLGFDNVCNEKQVSIAYNNIRQNFEVKWDTENNRQMEEMSTTDVFPVRPYAKDEPYNIARSWEIQTAFFASNNIRPIWHWAYYKMGTLDNTTGKWSGALGLIQRDEVDYVVNSVSFTIATSKVATFSPGEYFSPLYLWTRYPREFPPTWNLLGLFTKGYKSQSLES